MVELNNAFRLVRIAVFGATSLFAFIAIVLGGLITNWTDSFLGGFFSFAALAIATGLLTLLSLPAMLALSMIRKGAFTSMIAFEISWTGFLWILWLAVGGSSTNVYFIGGCGAYALFGSAAQAACSEASALTAFGFLSWIFLIFYNTALSALAFRLHFRGYTDIWTKDVTDTDFSATGVNNTQIIYDPKVSPTYATQYPPVGTTAPIIQQQTPGSYPQPQAPGLYGQPQAAGSFSHSSPQTPSGTAPYPQV